MVDENGLPTSDDMSSKILEREVLEKALQSEKKPAEAEKKKGLVERFREKVFGRGAEKQVLGMQKERITSMRNVTSLINMALPRKPSLLDILKARWIYLMVVGVLFTITMVAFWDAIIHQGEPTFQSMVALLVFLSVILYTYGHRRGYIRAEGETHKWRDIHGDKTIDYEEMQTNEAGVKYIIPVLRTHYGVIRGKDPFKPKYPFVIKLADECIYGVDDGMTTLGKMRYDGIDATISVDRDPDFIQNSETAQIAFQLSKMEDELAKKNEMLVLSQRQYTEIKEFGMDRMIDVMNSVLKPMLTFGAFVQNAKQMDRAIEMKALEIASGGYRRFGRRGMGMGEGVGEY